MTIEQGVFTWSGFTGAPGYTIQYGLPGGNGVANLRGLFEGIKQYLPSIVRITYPSSGDVINQTNGQVTGQWTATGQPQTVATGTGGFAAGTGLHINWITQTFVGGRRLTGRTFIVPVTVGCYSADGTLDNTVLSTIQTSVNTFIAASAGNFVIWHRPTSKGANDGLSATVTQGIVPDRVSRLKNRQF